VPYAATTEQFAPSAFAMQLDIRCRSEADLLHQQSCHLRDARPCVVHAQQQSVIPPSIPRTPIRDREKCIHLLARQRADEFLFLPLYRNGHHLRDLPEPVRIA
jgi:hypothetical protein